MERNAGELVAGGSGALALPAELLESARDYARASKAERTTAAYRSAWQSFSTWAEGQGLEALPAAPATVALYLASRADQGRKAATLDLDLAAIAAAHKAAGLLSPRSSAEVQAVRAGIRRTHGTAQRKAAALLPAQLRAIVAALPATRRGARDRALLLLGFAMAGRRSELAALRIEDLAFVPQGLEVTIRRSKTDQEGRGEVLAVDPSRNSATCPVRAVRAWLEAAELKSGPVFRQVNRHGQVGAAALSGFSIGQIVKETATAAGFDAAHFSGHSMRAGFATAKAQAGGSIDSIMRQTRHRSERVARGYVRAGNLWTNTPGAGLLD